MAPIIGNASLYIAILFSLISIVYKPWQHLSGRQASHTTLLWLWGAIFISVSTAFLCLIYCFAISDFSVINVLNNSHTSKPLIYKIAATWGNHEGSMLLWVVCVAFFSCVFGFSANKNMKFVQTALVIQAILMLFFLSFIIFASNPFIRVFPTPINGFGLNPILQDIGLAMHPPMLYLGYVGFSIVYSSAIAALWHGEINRNWAQNIRIISLFSWSCLTLGILLGSWWAYRELGWGGFWFWDPVENASLMPWLIGCAFLHSLAALRKYDLHGSWCYILATLTFSMSVIGTFIVRSGLVTSVHAFANDPKRGMFILVFITILLGGAIILPIFKKLPTIKQSQFYLSSREGFIYWNNLLLCTAAFIVMLGTLYPKVVELIWGELISVGAPYFNQLIAPIAIIIAILCTLGTHTLWGESLNRHRLYQPILSFLLALAASFIAIILGANNVICLISIFSGVGLLISQLPVLRIAPISSLAHMGVAVLIISIASNTMLQKQEEKIMAIGDTIHLDSLTFQLHDIRLYKEQNYLARQAVIEVKKGDQQIVIMKPETHFFPVEKQQTTEAAISTQLLYDIYIAVGQVYENGDIVVRVYIRPMITGIWLGGGLIIFSGIIAIILFFKKK